MNGDHTACGPPEFATQSAISNSVERILDSASDCHVCTNKALLSNLRQDDGPLVFDWEGKPSRSRGHVGDLELRVRNENQPDTTALLQLSTVIYTATGTTNLLSLDKLEKDGWEFIKLRKQSWAWLRKGSVLLKLMKTRGRYRLQATAAPVVKVEAAAQTRLGDERALVRLHARLGHLNYGALQQMVRDETVDGLELSAYLRERGICLITTNTYSPEENGLVEHMHGIVLSRIGSLLTTVDMPELLWGEAFQFAVEVLNVSPSSALAGETPYTRRFGERPDISTVRTWGCLVYAFTQKRLRQNKLENPGKPYIFLVYAKRFISYRLLDLRTGDIKELRTVEFAEDWTVDRSYVEKLLLNRYLRGKYRLPAKIPYVRLDKLISPSPTTTLGLQNDDEHRNKRHCSQDFRTHIVVDAPPATGASVLWSLPISGVLSMNPTRTAEADARSSRAREVRGYVPSQIPRNIDGGGGAEGGEDLSNRSCSAPSECNGDLSNRRDSVCSSNPLAFSDFDEDDMDQSWSDANDEATGAVIANGDPVEGTPRSVGVGKERDDEDDIELGDRFEVIQSVNELLEPTSVPEALSAPDALKWIEALDTEYQEQIRNHVWDLVDRPPGEKVLKNKWVFVKKRNAKGEIVRYLTGTTDYGLVWTVSDKVPDFQVAAYVDASRRSLKEVKVEAYADADLGNEKDDRRSVTGFVLQLNGCTYAYASRKQRLITDDTCSAEFVAAAESSTMMMWTLNLFEELGLRRSKTTLYDDNQAAIAVIKANTGHFKVKGVDLKYHKVRDYFERGEFDLEYCPSEDNVADIFTKPLGPTQFKKLRQRLNVIPVPEINADMKTGQN
ncbi:unnamed protein product [Phytophthora fragariaefolia]|uniref:Unnamed protein product n=1 Tax=Phytophthora fragariaefolia TaxID=1490495 RepID=A0A9W6WVQ6_9STRA|nr:unnamed protein product [Phytophthora fragariaefolia]